MAIVNWVIVCLKVERDDHNRLSLIKLINGVAVDRVPFALRDFVIVSEFEGNDGESIDYTVEIEHPGGKVERTHSAHIDFGAGGQTVFHTFSPISFLFPTTGIYNVRVSPTGGDAYITKIIVSV